MCHRVAERFELAVRGLSCGLCACERILTAATLRDVSDELRCADQPARAVAYGRVGYRDVDEAAILVHAYGLGALDFAGCSALQNLDLLGFSTRRNQRRHSAPDHFLGGIAEQLMSTFVPAGDDAVECGADDGVV